MPLIDVIDDDNSNNEQSMDSLQDILNASRPSLRIPKAFQETDQDVKTEPAALDAWMEASYVSMKRIYSAVRVSDKTTVDGQLVPLIELIVPLTGVRPWVKPEARELAQSILSCPEFHTYIYIYHRYFIVAPLPTSNANS